MAQRRDSELSIMNTKSQNLSPPSHRPDEVSVSESAAGLRSKLMELLESADIAKEDFRIITSGAVNSSATPSTFTPMSDSQQLDSMLTNNAQQIQSGHDKEILLEEAAMIHKLHTWIQQKGRPAIQRVIELQGKVDDYEQQISILKYRLETLTDEVTKVNEEKLILQSKLESTISEKEDLAETVRHAMTYTGMGYTNSFTDALEIPEINEVSQSSTNYQLKIDQLTSRNDEQLQEIANLRKWNVEYLEETMSLKKKLQLKEKEIKGILAERDEWENRYEVTEQDLRLSVQKMHELTQNDAFKYQSEENFNGPNDLTSAALRRLSAADPYQVHKPHHQQMRTVGGMSDYQLYNVVTRKTSWRSDVTRSRATSINSKYTVDRSRNPSLVEPLMEAGDVNMDDMSMTTKLKKFKMPIGGISNEDVAGLDIRSVRLSLWCVIFWIFSVAELSYYAHTLSTTSYELYLLLYVIGDACLLIGVVATLNHIYLGYGPIGGSMFIIGGFIHMVETAVYVKKHCTDVECLILQFGYDFMAETLSILVGLDVMTHAFDRRVFRVISLSGILAFCSLMIASVWKESDSLIQEDLRGNDGSFAVEMVTLWITGIVSAFLFIALCVMVIAGIKEENITRNLISHTINGAIGFMLLHSAGLLFYALPGYQVLLMLSVAVKIAYEMLFF